MPSKPSVPAPRWEPIPSHESPYPIERENKQRDSLPLDSPLAAIFLLLRWLLYAAYLVERYKQITALPSLPSPAHLQTYSVLIFFVEICARFGPLIFQTEMALYLLFRGNKKAWQRPRYRLIGHEKSPTVDVFVTCCGEDLELIMDTVRSAAAQDYPLDSYRVFVLDDAADGELRDAISTYNAERPRGAAQEVRYLSRVRVRGEAPDAKAGNLRFGIEESRKMAGLGGGGGGGVYIAALDVDAIPEPDWLRRMVPHLVLDPGLAAVVPGLRHYNLPADDALGQDIATPWDISIEHMRDAMGVTNLYGSGYVMRRSALDSIGGWPLMPSAEDLCCGHLLAGQGWKMAFCWDICQHDLTPGSLDALVSQRLRWTEGDLNLAWRFRFFLPGLDPGRRSLARRATALVGSLRLYKGLLDAVFLMLLAPIILFTLPPMDNHIVSTGPNSRARLLRLAYLASLIVDKLSPLCSSGLLMGSTTSVSWFTPFEAMASIRFHWPNSKLSFVPTGTVISSSQERSSRLRKPFLVRLLSPMMLFYVGYVVACLLSLATFFVRFVSWYHTTAQRRREGGAGHILQGSVATPALVILIECISAMSVPVLYMTWPPTVPERRELLEDNGRGGVRARIKQAGAEASVAGGIHVPWAHVLQIVAVVLVDWVM